MAKKLLDQARDQLRIMHYSYRTEETYLHFTWSTVRTVRIRVDPFACTAPLGPGQAWFNP